MGILPNVSSTDTKQAPTTKPKSRQIDLSGLKPLKADKGTTGFAGYRDQKRRNGVKRKDDDDMDSDVEEDGPYPTVKTKPKIKREPGEDDTNGDLEEEGRDTLSVEELRRRGELAEGVKKMQLKRQHSFDPSQGRHLPSQDDTNATTTSSLDGNTSNGGSPDIAAQSPALPQSQASRLLGAENGTSFNSPFKKQRASVTAETVPPLSPLNLGGNVGPANPQNTTLDASSVPDISFTPASAQPSFNAAMAGEPKATTTGIVEEATAVPPPPTPSPNITANTPNKVDSMQQSMDQDEEL